jgi:hypothetical protein
MQIMRTIMLVACALVFGLGLRQSLGEVTANWMTTTWISTVGGRAGLVPVVALT